MDMEEEMPQHEDLPDEQMMRDQPIMMNKDTMHLDSVRGGMIKQCTHTPGDADMEETLPMTNKELSEKVGKVAFASEVGYRRVPIVALVFSRNKVLQKEKESFCLG